MIHLNQISLQVGNRTLLNPTSLDITSGVTALMGLNGAGKTTLLKSLAGLTKFTSGSVNWSNTNTNRTVGFAPQFAPSVRSLNLIEVMQYLAGLDGLSRRAAQERAEEVLWQVGLEKHCRTSLSQISGGEAKRLSIAQALLGNPSLLLLDEPTSGLDPKQRQVITAIIQEFSQDRPVVFSTHHFEDVEEVADRVWWMHDGNLEDLGAPNSQKVTDLRTSLRTS